MAVQLNETQAERTVLRSGEEFLNALDDGRRVFIGGEAIDNVATHPKTSAYARQLARFYDMHLDPEIQDVMTFVDEEGVRRSMQWLLMRDKEQVIARRKFHELVLREIGYGQFGRTPDVNNLVYLTYIDHPEPWAEQSLDVPEGKIKPENLVNFWNRIRDENLNVAPAVIDAQPNRSKPEAYHESPDLRCVEKNDEGIVVRGLKAVATGSIFGDWLAVGVFYRPGMEPDQIMYFATPTNAEGITIVSREPAQKSEYERADHPLATLGDELDNFVIFDDVFVPWENVFHMGNPEHAKLYPQRLFDFLHWQDSIRHSVKAELMVGLAILITDSLGTLQIPAVQMRLTDIVRFREAVRAHLIAAEDTGFMSPGGMYRPNNLFYDFGRAYFIEYAPKFIQELLDLVGRGTVMVPTDGDWNHPEIGKWLKPLMAGNTSEDERLRIIRVIRDLYLSEWGRRNSMFDNFNGTPITAVRLLTMNRTEYQPDGPLTVLARQVCDLPLREGQLSHREQVPEYARKIDARTL